MSGFLVSCSKMGEAPVIEKKQETKNSQVWIITADGYVEQFESKVAILCGTLCKEMQSGHGCCMSNPIFLPPAIKPPFLLFVFDYCQYHHIPDSPYKRNTFDENLLEMDANLLCELMYVAHCLQMESLIDRTFEAILKKIERNSSFEELWHMFDCPDDVTLTRLSMPRQYEETRSIDDLLVFIEGADGGFKCF